MSINGYKLIKKMEEYAPPQLAVENDRIGLQLGDPNSEVKKVLVTLDVTEPVIDEAIRIGANWIIAHHALIFRPIRELRVDTPSGKIFQKCFQHELNIYIAHTNLDVTTHGVNDVLAEKLALKKIRPLFTEQSDRLKKLVVFIPTTHLDDVQNAICAAGAGWIGNYSHCTYQTTGTGTFLPNAESDPFLGKRGELTRVEEVRLETVVTEQIEKKVLQAMFAAHPYEEVAYDLYPLSQRGKEFGLGRIGSYPEAISFSDFAERVKQAYQVNGLRVVGDPAKSIQTVAVLGGSGARYWSQVQRKQADVYVTGDIDFHTAQDALASDLALVDPGHHVENLVIETVCEELRRRLSDVVILPSEIDTNPFRFV